MIISLLTPISFGSKSFFTYYLLGEFGSVERLGLLLLRWVNDLVGLVGSSPGR